MEEAIANPGGVTARRRGGVVRETYQLSVANCGSSR